MVQNGQDDHCGQNDRIPNRICVFARPKWTSMVHFGPWSGPFWSIWVRQPYSGHSRFWVWILGCSSSFSLLSQRRMGSDHLGFPPHMIEASATKTHCYPFARTISFRWLQTCLFLQANATSSSASSRFAAHLSGKTCTQKFFLTKKVSNWQEPVYNTLPSLAAQIECKNLNAIRWLSWWS